MNSDSEVRIDKVEKAVWNKPVLQEMAMAKTAGGGDPGDDGNGNRSAS